MPPSPLDDVLLFCRWRDESVLSGMTEEDKRSALVTDISHHSGLTPACLQARPTAELVDIGSLIGVLLRNNWRTKWQLGTMSSHQDIRNTVIVGISKERTSSTTVEKLQALSDAQLVRLACPGDPEKGQGRTWSGWRWMKDRMVCLCNMFLPFWIFAIVAIVIIAINQQGEGKGE